MRKKIRWLFFLLSTLLVVVFTFLWAPVFLSIHHPVDSSNYVLESWVNAYEREEAVRLIQNDSQARVYIIGQKFPVDDDVEIYPEKPVYHGNGIWLLANSSVVLEPELFDGLPSGDTLQVIVKAQGTFAAGIAAHCNLIVNGKKVHSFFTSDNLENFWFHLNLNEQLKSIALSFDNDFYTGSEDRNLNVYSIQLADKEILMNPENVEVYKCESGKLTGFSSGSHQMKSYLSDLGVDPGILFTVVFEPVNYNQTFAGAKAFDSWSNTKGIGSLNLVSSGIHSRRTWVTYKKVLSPDVEVGIYYFEPLVSSKEKSKDILNQYQELSEELFSYVLSWFQITFTG